MKQGNVTRIAPYLALLMTVSLAAACQSGSQIPPTPTRTATPTATATPTPPQGVRNVIAYVSNDFDVYAIRPDGTHRKRITPRDALYTWPTWAPFGDKIAYSSFSEEPLGPGKALHALALRDDVGSGESQVVFENAPDTPPAVGVTIPHYAAWSPDGTKLAFLAMAPEGLSLYVAGAGQRGTPAQVASGSPFYFSWSNDSESLLLHKQGELLRVDVDAPDRILSLEAGSANYRVPKWSPSSNATTFITSEDEDGSSTLYTARFDGSRREALGHVEGVAAFEWSPRGERLAVGQSGEATDPFLHDIRIIDAASGDSLTLFEGAVLAFFWSPDGRRLAFVTTNEAASALQWRVVDVESGEETTLVDFRPSNDQLALLTFFDQYSISHNVWSPDGTKLVFAGALAKEEGASSSGPTASTVFTIDATGEHPAEALTPGRMATWTAS